MTNPVRFEKAKEGSVLGRIEVDGAVPGGAMPELERLLLGLRVQVVSVHRSSEGERTSLSVCELDGAPIATRRLVRIAAEVQGALALARRAAA